MNVDNSDLKQRIAALAQDKLFKDAHCEALKKEVSRLRQLYHEQQQHLQKEMHASSTGAYDLQQQQFGKLEQGSSSRMMDQKPEISDPSPSHPKTTSGIPDHRENNASHSHTAPDEYDCRSAASIPSKGSQDFDRLDEEQLMSMFADVEPFNKSQSNQSSNPPTHQTSALDNRCSDRQATSENPSTPSDHNSSNEPSMEEKVMTVSGQFK
ncbi:hypothetical protein KI387_037135, partial [Taxus chinensis]